MCSSRQDLSNTGWFLLSSYLKRAWLLETITVYMNLTWKAEYKKRCTVCGNIGGEKKGKRWKTSIIYLIHRFWDQLLRCLEKKLFSDLFSEGIFFIFLFSTSLCCIFSCPQSKRYYSMLFTAYYNQLVKVTGLNKDGICKTQFLSIFNGKKHLFHALYP